MNPEIESIYRKILHTNTTFFKTDRIYTTFFPSQEMNRAIRKIFREQDIKYTYSRKHNRITVNNSDGHPFSLWFQFLEDDYIRVSTIPMSYDFQFLAKDPADLFRKMVDKKIITVRQWRKVVPTQKAEKKMRNMAIRYWKRQLMAA